MTALAKGKTFKPHKHIEKVRTYEKQIAQESWVVIRGSVKCIFYDLDDNIIVLVTNLIFVPKQIQEN